MDNRGIVPWYDMMQEMANLLLAKRGEGAIQ